MASLSRISWPNPTDGAGVRWLLLGKDGDDVGHLAPVALLVVGHDGVVEDLVGPRDADGGPLLDPERLRDRDERGVDEDAHVAEVLLPQRLSVGVAPDLVA